jgi:hypothetical protein
MGRRNISTNKAARLLLRSMAAGRQLSEWMLDGQRAFYIDDDAERYGWNAVWPLFAEKYVEQDNSEPDADAFMLEHASGRYVCTFVLTDAGRDYVAKRFPQKAA